jgi:TolB-like protein
MADLTFEPRTIRFADFELDVGSGELRKSGGDPVLLAEQPFRILATLIRQSGNLVTRDELRRQLWPEDTFVDFENSLNAAIKRLRTALGDSATDPRFIQTIPRRGYRFIAPSKVIDSALPIESTLPVEVPAAVLENDPAIHPLVPSSIAVLPFVNLSADPLDDYFGEGLTEELINALTQIARLRVVSRYASRFLEDTDIKMIARELHVDRVLEGSVRRAGKRLRVSVRLVNVDDGCNVWSDRYDCAATDVFDVQGEIAGSVAQAIESTLAGRPQLPRRHCGANVDAFELYLRARQHWHQRTPESLQASIADFEAVIRLDPEYTLAHAGLADSYSSLGFYGYLAQ